MGAPVELSFYVIEGGDGLPCVAIITGHLKGEVVEVDKLLVLQAEVEAHIGGGPVERMQFTTHQRLVVVGDSRPAERGGGVGEAIGVIIDLPFRLITILSHHGPLVLMQCPVVEVIFERQETDVGHLNGQRCGGSTLRTVGIEGGDGIVIGAIIVHFIDKTYLINRCIVHLGPIPIDIKSYEGGGRGETTGTNARAHLVGSNEDVINHQHESIVGHAVDSNIFSLLGNGVFHEGPLSREFDIVAFVDKDEI